jgi:RHS repeat-associated protein
VVQENTSGVATNLLQGPGTDNLLQRGSNWFVPASLGSTSTVVDGSGSVLQRYYYHPFGQLALQGAGSPQPYQFTGREADAMGLMYYRARYYNRSWGRFISEDPLGMDGASETALSAVREESLWTLGVRSPGPGWTLNPYAYAADNPVNATDPSGLEPMTADDREAAKGVLNMLAAAWHSVWNTFVSFHQAIGQSLATSIFPDPADILTPGGNPVGTPGTKPDIREVPGGDTAARNMFGELTQGATIHTPGTYPGTGANLPGGGWVGLRLSSKSGPPTIDVKIPGIPIGKIKFLP